MARRITGTFCVKIGLFHSNIMFNFADIILDMGWKLVLQMTNNNFTLSSYELA